MSDNSIQREKVERIVRKAIIEDRGLTVSQRTQGRYVERAVDKILAALRTPDSAPRVMTAEEEAEDDVLRDQVALEVLCRVFEDGADAGIEEWREWYDPSEWLWWARGLGAFIHRRLDRLAPDGVEGRGSGGWLVETDDIIEKLVRLLRTEGHQLIRENIVSLLASPPDSEGPVPLSETPELLEELMTEHDLSCEVWETRSRDDCTCGDDPDSEGEEPIGYTSPTEVEHLRDGVGGWMIPKPASDEPAFTVPVYLRAPTTGGGERDAARDWTGFEWAKHPSLRALTDRWLAQADAARRGRFELEDGPELVDRLVAEMRSISRALASEPVTENEMPNEDRARLAWLESWHATVSGPKGLDLPDGGRYRNDALARIARLKRDAEPATLREPEPDLWLYQWREYGKGAWQYGELPANSITQQWADHHEVIPLACYRAVQPPTEGENDG